MPARVYLDVSCLGRPFDDQSQERVRREAHAVDLIIKLADEGRLLDVSSHVSLAEILATPDPDKRDKMLALLPEESRMIALSDTSIVRGSELETLGFKQGDALHIALAELSNADVLLTCDDRLLRTARRHRQRLGLAVWNPVDWLEEFSDDAQR